MDEIQEISRWRSRSRSGDRRIRGRHDKGLEDQKPRSNSAAPTSGAPIARIGPNIQITKKGNGRVVTETGNTVSASTSGPGTSTGNQGSASGPGTSAPSATGVTTVPVVTIGDNTEGLGGQPSSSQVSGDGLRNFRIPKYTGRGKTSKTKTVEEIQEQVSNDPSLGVKMGKCIIKLSKKAKNKSGPGKLKKKWSYRRV